MQAIKDEDEIDVYDIDMDVLDFLRKQKEQMIDNPPQESLLLSLHDEYSRRK